MNLKPLIKFCSIAAAFIFVYFVFSAVDTDLSQTYAYPVPFKPSAGHQKITFAFLPVEGKIRVYSSAGELLRTLDFSSPIDGKLEWDVTNSDGEKLGSDVYVYILESGGSSKTGKLLVVR